MDQDQIFNFSLPELRKKEKDRKRKTQQQIFKENHNLKKAYAANATKKSRARAKHQTEQLKQSNLLLEQEKDSFQHRISVLKEEIKELEKNQTGLSSSLIIKNQVLSKQVETHRQMISQIKSLIGKAPENEILLNLSNLGFKTATASVLTACYESMKNVSNDWQVKEFCGSNFNNFGCFKNIEKVKLTCKIVFENSSPTLVECRYDLFNINVDVETLHEALWECSQSKNEESINAAFGIKYGYDVSDLTENIVQLDRVDARKPIIKKVVCSENPSNRIFLTEMTHKDKQEQIFLTAETTEQINQGAFIKNKTGECAAKLIINTLLGATMLKNQLVTNRLQIKANSIVKEEVSQKMIEAFIITNFGQSSTVSNLTLITQTELKSDGLEFMTPETYFPRNDCSIEELYNTMEPYLKSVGQYIDNFVTKRNNKNILTLK